jgi:DNA-binding GntR family transcriptional regulator
MRDAELTERIAGLILDEVKAAGLAAGTRLTERQLAERFEVSRSPVRSALGLLATMGVVEAEPQRGYRLRKDAALLAARRRVETSTGERVYHAIAEDRLAGRLPERISESRLMARYGVTRGALLKHLGRMTQEGWAERLPGGGWRFLATMTSADSFGHAYDFRAVIEPAALLSPGFRVDAEAFRRERDRQKALLDGDLARLARGPLFDINAGFHEMLAACSGNPFFLDALCRINRLRRLIEYRTFVDKERLAAQCREHLALLDMVEAGSRDEAAGYLLRHLQGAAARKQAAGLVRSARTKGRR